MESMQGTGLSRFATDIDNVRAVFNEPVPTGDGGVNISPTCPVRKESGVTFKIPITNVPCGWRRSLRVTISCPSLQPVSSCISPAVLQKAGLPQLQELIRLIASARVA